MQPLVLLVEGPGDLDTSDSAPNFVALVQSSLSVIANAITAPDTILRSGPSGSCPYESKPCGA
jgi:hypothetical protein